MTRHTNSVSNLRTGVPVDNSQTKEEEVTNDRNDKLPDSPISELAAAASQLHELFVSFREAGFTEAQALTLVGKVLQNGASQ